MSSFLLHNSLNYTNRKNTVNTPLNGYISFLLMMEIFCFVNQIHFCGAPRIFINEVYSWFWVAKTSNLSQVTQPDSHLLNEFVKFVLNIYWFDSFWTSNVNYFYSFSSLCMSIWASDYRFIFRMKVLSKMFLFVTYTNLFNWIIFTIMDGETDNKNNEFFLLFRLFLFLCFIVWLTDWVQCITNIFFHSNL